MTRPEIVTKLLGLDVRHLDGANIEEGPGLATSAIRIAHRITPWGSIARVADVGSARRVDRDRAQVKLARIRIDFACGQAVSRRSIRVAPCAGNTDVDPACGIHRDRIFPAKSIVCHEESPGIDLRGTVGVTYLLARRIHVADVDISLCIDGKRWGLSVT